MDSLSLPLVGITLTILLLPAKVLPQKLVYSFTGCQDTAHSKAAQDIQGAYVLSQDEPLYTQPNLRCSVAFAVPDPEMSFLIQILSLDLPDPEDTQCSDSISVIATDPQNLSTTLFGPLCGTQVTSDPLWAVTPPNSKVSIQWNTGPSVLSAHKGFQLVLTAVLPPSACSQDSETDVLSRDSPAAGVSHNPSLFLCRSQHQCISSSLLCDHVPHCRDGSDEYNCHKPSLLELALAESPMAHPPPALAADDSMISNNPNTPVTTTTLVTRPSSPPGDTTDAFQEVDMVSIIVVGVLFVVILMICIILACRSKGGEMEALSEESNQLRLDVSTNPGYSESEGVPATPPPTYSMIERQTSYVSQISMSSSQVSVPPDYEEALELDEDGNPRPRRTSSRQSSTRQGNRTGGPAVRSASGYSRNYPRIPGHPKYRRTQSASDGSERPRFLSQNSIVSQVGPIDEMSTEDISEEVTDDLFLDTPSTVENPSSLRTEQGSSVPVTSTPHLEAGYNIEMMREDSSAPLFRLGGSPESDVTQDTSLSETSELSERNQTRTEPKPPDPPGGSSGPVA